MLLSAVGYQMQKQSRKRVKRAFFPEHDLPCCLLGYPARFLSGMYSLVMHTSRGRECPIE